MKAAVKRANKKIGDVLYGWAFLTPSLFGVLMFFIVPFGLVIYYAFIDNPMGQNFVLFRNFEHVLGNLAFRTASRNTIAFTALAVPMAVILSMGLAILLEQKIPAKSQLRTFFLSPMMVPVVSIVLIWEVFFHQNGAVNNAVASLGEATGWFTYERAGGGWIDWFNSPWNQLPIVVLFLWRNLGYNMILFMAALANIPREITEMAEIEGASSLYIFRTIKLRFLSPTILFVTILSIINSFKVFREVFLLTGRHPYGSLYMLQHYMNNMFENLDYQSLAAAAIIMTLVMILIIGVLFAVEGRYGKDVEG